MEMLTVSMLKCGYDSNHIVDHIKFSKGTQNRSHGSLMVLGSPFWGFVNQVCTVIQMHPPQYPTTTAWVGLVGTLLTGTSMVWAISREEVAIVGVHWWHLDASKHHNLDQRKLNIRWMQPHILSMLKCPTLFLLTAPLRRRLRCHSQDLSLKVSKPSMSIFWCPQHISAFSK